jgi:hypothetical protein
MEKKLSCLITPFLICTVSVAFFGACTSYYSAGPFGHEVIPVPPRAPSQTVSGETFVLARLNASSSNFRPDDHSWFAQAGLMRTQYVPISEKTRADISFAASGWFGRAELRSEYEDPEVAGLLPGDYDYYGGTAQFASFLRFGHRRAFRIGFTSLISYEDGPYADFRRDIDDIDAIDWSDSDYVNLSPTPWSHSHRLEEGFEIPVDDDATILLSIYEGIGYAELFSNDYGKALFGITGMLRYRGFAVYGSYQIMGTLNNSLNIGAFVSIH